MAKVMKMTCDECGIEATNENIRKFKLISIGSYSKLPTVSDPMDYITNDSSKCLCEKCFRKYEERNGVL